MRCRMSPCTLIATGEGESNRAAFQQAGMTETGRSMGHPSLFQCLFLAGWCPLVVLCVLRMRLAGWP